MRPLEEVASWDGIFSWPLSLCPFLHLLFARKPPSLHPIVIVICLHPWGQATTGCVVGQNRSFLPSVILSSILVSGIREVTVFSPEPLSQAKPLFASSSALLISTDWLCLTGWAKSLNSSFVSQLPCQRTQEDGFCLACVLERSPPSPFLLLSQIYVGKPVLGNGMVISPEVWAEVTWGVLPSTACDVPRFQSGLHFSNPKPRRIGGITCPASKSSYLSMFRSCKLELFPRWICQLTICLGTQLGVLRGSPRTLLLSPSCAF